MWSKFHHHGNDMNLLMKFYTINHSHYHHLVPLMKRVIRNIPSRSMNSKKYLFILSHLLDIIVSELQQGSETFICSRIVYLPSMFKHNCKYHQRGHILMVNKIKNWQKTWLRHECVSMCRFSYFMKTFSMILTQNKLLKYPYPY